MGCYPFLWGYVALRSFFVSGWYPDLPPRCGSFRSVGIPTGNGENLCASFVYLVPARLNAVRAGLCGSTNLALFKPHEIPETVLQPAALHREHPKPPRSLQRPVGNTRNLPAACSAPSGASRKLPASCSAKPGNPWPLPYCRWGGMPSTKSRRSRPPMPPMAKKLVKLAGSAVAGQLIGYQRPRFFAIGAGPPGRRPPGP